MPHDADGEFDLLAHGDRDETWRKLGKLVAELGMICDNRNKSDQQKLLFFATRFCWRGDYARDYANMCIVFTEIAGIEYRRIQGIYNSPVTPEHFDTHTHLRKLSAPRVARQDRDRSPSSSRRRRAEQAPQHANMALIYTPPSAKIAAEDVQKAADAHGCALHETFAGDSGNLEVMRRRRRGGRGQSRWCDIASRECHIQGLPIWLIVGSLDLAIITYETPTASLSQQFMGISFRLLRW